MGHILQANDLIGNIMRKNLSLVLQKSHQQHGTRHLPSEEREKKVVDYLRQHDQNWDATKLRHINVNKTKDGMFGIAF